MSAISNIYALRKGTWLGLAAFAMAASTFAVPNLAAAQERLPWQRGAAQSDYSSQNAPAAAARSRYDRTARDERVDRAGGYADPAAHDGGYEPAPGGIRQPRSEPYYAAPPRRAPVTRSFERDRASGSYDRNQSGQTYGRDRSGQSFDQNRSGQAYDRNDRGYNDRPYERARRDGPRRSGSSPAPYASRSDDLPSYYDQAPAPGNARQANYDANNSGGYNDAPRDGSYSMSEIRATGHSFFGSISKGLASVIEHAFKHSGRPNGYILGEGAGGAFIAGLRYGEGTLYTKYAGQHKVYWQGPSIGYDAGAEGSKTMVLVYNLRRPSDLYKRFGGVDGSAYLVGGVGITFLSRNKVILAPIRAGVGLRFGANIGYLKYTRRPTWNPF